MIIYHYCRSSKYICNDQNSLVFSNSNYKLVLALEINEKSDVTKFRAIGHLLKKFQFINNQSKKEFLALPETIKRRFANDLNAICQNKQPFSKFKHLKDSVGVGAIELIENGRPAYRTIYVAKFTDVVFILHSFSKTTNGVDRQAMETAKKRYRLIKKENK